jgi:hypothetical protein
MPASPQSQALGLRNSPHRQRSSTNKRIALDRLPLRSRSMDATSALSDWRRRAAISANASQNAVSTETLVEWPAMRTERFCGDGWFTVFQDGDNEIFFKHLSGYGADAPRAA